MSKKAWTWFCEKANTPIPTHLTAAAIWNALTSKKMSSKLELGSLMLILLHAIWKSKNKAVYDIINVTFPLICKTFVKEAGISLTRLLGSTSQALPWKVTSQRLNTASPA